MGRITKSLPYMYLNEHLDTWYFLLIKSCKHDSFNVVNQSDALLNSEKIEFLHNWTMA